MPDPQPAKGRKLSPIVIVAIVALVAVGGWWLYKRKKAADAAAQTAADAAAGPPQPMPYAGQGVGSGSNGSSAAGGGMVGATGSDLTGGNTYPTPAPPIVSQVPPTTPPTPIPSPPVPLPPPPGNNAPPSPDPSGPAQPAATATLGQIVNQPSGSGPVQPFTTTDDGRAIPTTGTTTAIGPQPVPPQTWFPPVPHGGHPKGAGKGRERAQPMPVSGTAEAHHAVSTGTGWNQLPPGHKDTS